jgi:hypothetical protein
MNKNLHLPADDEAHLRVVEGAPGEPKDLRERLKGALDDEVAIGGVEAVIDHLRGEAHGLSRDERREVIFRLVWRKEEELAKQSKEGESSDQA